MRKIKYKSHNKAIDEILNPLKQSMGISYFTYCKYNEEICEVISSDPIAANTFLNDTGSTLPTEATSKNAILGWDEYCSSTYYEYIVDRYKGCNGVTFVLRHNDTCAEYIALNTNDININLKELLHSEPGLINNIVAHIRNHVNFNKDKLETFYFYKENSKKDNAKMKPVVNLIKLHNREFIYGLNGPTYITRAEKKCLLLALKMQTSKQISIETETSIRTVECHLANIKKKLGTHKRHQLYQIALNNFIL